MSSYSIFKNSKIWRIRTPHVNKITLLVQTQDKEESEEYFTSPQNSDYNEDGRLESNMEDQNSHLKILQNGK
jgi:hypothetical protein